MLCAGTTHYITHSSFAYSIWAADKRATPAGLISRTLNIAHPANQLERAKHKILPILSAPKCTQRQLVSLARCGLRSAACREHVRLLAANANLPGSVQIISRANCTSGCLFVLARESDALWRCEATRARLISSRSAASNGKISFVAALVLMMLVFESSSLQQRASLAYSETAHYCSVVAIVLSLCAHSKQYHPV